MMKRRLSIRERGLEFTADPILILGDVHYEPRVNTEGFVTLFHDTCLSNYDKFIEFGIKLMTFDTKFSPSPAFYLANQVTTVFEFPLHNKPASSVYDSVSVF